MSKVKFFHHYIIDAFRSFPAWNHPIIAKFSNFWDWFYKLLPQMLFLSHFLGWYYIGWVKLVELWTASECFYIVQLFFHKTKFIFENCLFWSHKNASPGTFIHRWKKRLSYNLEEELVKVIPKKEEKSYICIKSFYKFFNIFKSYQNFINRHSEKLSKTYLVNIKKFRVLHNLHGLFSGT